MSQQSSLLSLFSFSLEATHMGIANGCHRFTMDLLMLESTSPLKGSWQDSVPLVSNFFPLSEWVPYLASYPDQVFAGNLHPRFKHSFRIDFHSLCYLHFRPSNKKSMHSLPEDQSPSISRVNALKRSSCQLPATAYHLIAPHWYYTELNSIRPKNSS